MRLGVCKWPLCIPLAPNLDVSFRLEVDEDGLNGDPSLLL